MFFETIELTRFINSEIHEREINGNMEECISIPLRINGIDKLPNGRCFLNCFLFDRHPNCENITHVVSIKYRDQELYKKLIQLGYDKNIKFLGKVKNAYWRTEFKPNVDGKRTPLEKAMNTDYKKS